VIAVASDLTGPAPDKYQWHDGDIEWITPPQTTRRDQTVTPEREHQIRALLDDEYRDACQLSDAVDDLLTELDQVRGSREAADRPDTKGRTPADRIAAVRRATLPTPEQQQAATALLVDMLAAAARHGITLDDLDWVTDLPGACYDAVFAKRDRTS
jgi:hypothetical protein